MPIRVVGVRFKKAGKVYYFDPADISLDKGEHVVVETTRGIEYGEVVVAPRDVADEEVVAPLKQVLRKTTPEDDQQIVANKEKEQKAYEVALEKIALHQLPMKLISVEQTFDGNKIIFYFTADGRIDFRELVKDLAAVFRTRIELRQIGVRDEAKMVGGLGCCGRELCCASWLADFAPVSIRMAKEQNLSLNPTKISGICGRLMCCLKYENDVYEEAKAGYPNIGTQVLAPEGDGKVIAVNIFRKTVSVEIQESKTIIEYSLSDLKTKKSRGECNCGCPARQDKSTGTGPSSNM